MFIIVKSFDMLLTVGVIYAIKISSFCSLEQSKVEVNLQPTNFYFCFTTLNICPEKRIDSFPETHIF